MRIIKERRHLLAVAITTLVTADALASDDNDFSVYGFVNLGVNYMDHDYVTYSSYESGDPTFFEQDTNMGLQISKPLTERTQATVQAMARAENDYAVETTLAFLSHSLSDSTELRAGRLRVPFFYYSEFLDVGYAYNWVSPPTDVYAIPFDDYDGIDITHRFAIGNNDAQVQINSGRRHKDLNLFGESYEAELDKIQGMSFTLYSGDFTHRAGYQQTSLNIELNTEGDLRRIDLAQLAARAVGTSNGISEDVIDDFNFEDKLTRYFNLASTYDNGDYSFVVEGTYLDYESGLLIDNFAWLASAAKRFGDLTLHATYSTSRDRVDGGEKGELQKLLNLQGEDDSVTLGMRYDLDAATALKFEMTHHDEETNRGQPGRSANLYRLALQLVF
ncbi:porin [Bacterioplanoides sp. SCSIO 12839]|uniref:porin n=1 Tax=Bacterioplanoides sp. SCSIO 12839 TaxID=2829569 RepID=UPI0021077CCE|nr:porin [Bacterioplanoides sp. SCSIO 12839]UTW48396.1 porin [Bacterioplanoides sp. SCSIO 12839]